MSKYIDGFVIPVSKNKIDSYRDVAAKACAIWMEHGALDYVEAVGDDLEVADQVPFTRLAGTSEEETVVFSYIVYRSREHRDEVNARVMADPRIHEICAPDEHPFDCKRMAWGGFRSIVSV